MDATEDKRLLGRLTDQREALERIGRREPAREVLRDLATSLDDALGGGTTVAALAIDVEPDAADWAWPFAVAGMGAIEPDDLTRELVGSYAAIGRIAIARERDAVALQREEANAHALHRVGQAIASRLDLNEVVQVATDEATLLTNASFGAFFYNVLDDDGASYLLYTLSGVPREAFERFPMPRATAIFGPTFKGEGVVRLDDVTQDERFGQNHPYEGLPPGHLPVRSYLAVPVALPGGEVAGAMFFGHPEAAVFGPEAEKLATGIAAQAAVAIENARLYAAAQREIAARREAFEERDRVARTLQESLLPPDLPRIEGITLAARYLPSAADIGGDFYDVFRLGDGRYGLVVGDVGGKGVAAARLTALTRHTVHTAAMTDPRPAEVLRLLNASLVEQAPDGPFCTASFSVLERRDDGWCLTTALGGHPPGLLLRGGQVRKIGVPGRMLGIDPELAVTEESELLHDGDVVVLHTDGLTDVTVGGRMLGEDWVHDLLRRSPGVSADEIAARLVDGAVLQQSGKDLRDDIAILALTLG